MIPNYVFIVLLLATVIVAFIKGGWAEKIGASMYVV